MIRKICRDPILLSAKSSDATILDAGIAKDLEDTLTANREDCVGMAANMIGISKRIIVFDYAGTNMTMFNPEIIAHKGTYEAIEGCLSLSGTRTVKRYKSITVKYQDKSFAWQQREFSGIVAEIIQHEIDHCNGILI